MGTKKFCLLAVLCITVSGCSPTDTTYTTDMAVGSVAGGAVGAGTGAIVGSMITNGVVGSSALVGGGVGIGVGAALGALYSTYSGDRQLDRYDIYIEENHLRYLETQREIEAMREQQLMDSKDIELDPSRGEYQYIGNSAGNPFR